MSLAATRPTTPGPRLDAWLLVSALALALTGLVMVASASVTMADEAFGAPFHYFLRQLVYLAAGAAIAAAIAAVPLRAWEASGPYLLGLAVLMLAAVLVPGVGREVNGATRWLPMGPVNVQASEPARLLVVLYLCGYVARRREALGAGFGGLVTPLVVLIVASALLLAQPDFGAMIVLLATAGAILFVGGMRLRDLAVLTAGASAAAAALLLTSDYRMRRLTAFMDPWADPWDSGFQLTQSLIAIGRGEWFGVGLGGSVQKLFYLPEAHTDFVFAVFAEEMGLVGVVALLALYGVVLWRAFAISALAAAAGRVFAACLAFGLGTWLGAQAFVNIAVNMGLLPTKGLTLPLVSFGGSSLVVSCVAIGLLLRIHYELAADGYAGRRARRAGR